MSEDYKCHDETTRKNEPEKKSAEASNSVNVR